MTIRKKILLFSALALGAFLTAVYIASKFALLNGYARLESNYAREKVLRLRDSVADEQDRLAIMARDYAQWDRTYDFMQSRNQDFVHTELTEQTFNIIHINTFILLDTKGSVVINRTTGSVALQDSDVALIAAAYQPEPRNQPVTGILQVRGHLLMLAYQPVLTSRGDGASRGTLVMGRDFNDSLIASLSRSAGLPVWLEPADHGVTADIQRAAWSDGTNSVHFQGESTMLAYVPLKDMFGISRRLLVARIPYDLNSEARKVMRYLLLLLMLAGVVHCGVLLLVLEENLLARLQKVNRRIKQVRASGDLSLRGGT